MRHWLRGRFPEARAVIDALAAETVRASALVEDLNRRLRNSFTLRRHLNTDSLSRLQFFLNHRPLERSDRPERPGNPPRRTPDRPGPPALAGKARLYLLRAQLTEPSREALPRTLLAKARGRFVLLLEIREFCTWQNPKHR